MSDPTLVEDAAVVGSPSNSGRGSLHKTIRDIALSMGIIGGIIAAAMLISWRPQPDPVRAVDSRPVAEAVAAAVDWPVLYPKVAEGWRATSARYEPSPESDEKPVWFNGWVTPDGQYAAVIQSKAQGQRFIEEQTMGGFQVADASTLPIGIDGWTAYASRDDDQRSLVRQQGRVTTVVTSTLPWDGVVAFLDSLEPVRVDRSEG